MGTNYYLAGLASKRLPLNDGRPHIGKASCGWAFGLHVDPKAGIHDLADWQRLWSRPGAVIVSEYKEEITPERMVAIITDRKGVGGRDLRRSYKGAHCLDHGAGTWDLMIGEFF